MCYKKDIKTIENEKILITFDFEEIFQENNYKLRNKIFEIIRLNYKNIL